MALLEWGNEYSVEVRSIDTQHMKLFVMLNELHDAMKAGKGSQLAPEILRNLVQYTREHFGKEEGMMSQARYPDLASHKAEHDKLTGEVLRMVRELDEGKAVLSMDLLEFLRKWLQTHILDRDKKYTAHMQAARIC
jgi:hemerythrin